MTEPREGNSMFLFKRRSASGKIPMAKSIIALEVCTGENPLMTSSIVNGSSRHYPPARIVFNLVVRRTLVWWESMRVHPQQHPITPVVEEGESKEAAQTPTEWTPVSGTAPDGSPPFIMHYSKSKIRGVNRNGFRNNYIFGKGPSGIGYYHISTKEAYQVLLNRIDKRLATLRGNLSCAKVCCFWCPPCVTSLEEQIAKQEEVREVVYSRSKADVPLGIPAVAGEETRAANTRYYGADGVWLFLGDFYACGGGCGAGDAGGGCGAGGCGAGACGGGCGGGGCGGGGCGC
mmetsp:Transcript_27381/g.57644  ORF Transcript_27381/g.57644 Transcript_27381/m.57644 type:complete len:289 (-) Transcript_27381:1194-2060(-)